MADTVTLNLTDSIQTGTANTRLTFYGVITNNGSNEEFSTPLLSNNVQAGACCGYDFTAFTIDTDRFDIAPFSTSAPIDLFSLTVASSANIGDVVTGTYRIVFYDQYDNFQYGQFSNWQFTVAAPQQAPVPEPSPLSIFGTALGILTFWRRKDRKG